MTKIQVIPRTFHGASVPSLSLSLSYSACNRFSRSPRRVPLSLQSPRRSLSPRREKKIRKPSLSQKLVTLYSLELIILMIHGLAPSVTESQSLVFCITKMLFRFASPKFLNLPICSSPSLCRTLIGGNHTSARFCSR
ncbi:hypothetical protein WN944_004312 [Citrus x changshan-huyou]|uniref:Uncharacterized protein n=1 Tax=Citrus x changshan-huyou TaxID=2935761 RepID=A0AAP0M055_9ROSI